MNKDIIRPIRESLPISDASKFAQPIKDFFPGHEGILTPGNAVAGIIIIDNDLYLCQLRSQKKGIFYPGHWGLFGGAVEPDECPENGLRRELLEELALEIDSFEYFTEFTFDFSFRGLGQIWRKYYLVPLRFNIIDQLKIGEGMEYKAFTYRELLTQQRIVPYDAFAVWLYATQRPDLQL